MQVISGIIASSYGIKGEVKVKSFTDFAATRFKKGSKVILRNVETKNEIETKVVSYRVCNGVDVVLFELFNNPEDVKKYQGYQILVEDDLKLPNNTYHYKDIWKSNVYYNNTLIGYVDDMFDGGANLILRIKRDDKKDLLYPFVSRFISNVDITNKRIDINPLEGMID